MRYISSGKTVFKDLTSNYSDPINRKVPNIQTIICHKLKIIDVAIIFDSSYCSNLDSREHLKFIIEDILLEASRILQNQENLCLTATISHLDFFVKLTAILFLMLEM